MNANSSKWGMPEHLRIVAIAMGILCITAAVIMTYHGKTMSIGNTPIAAGLIFLIAGLVLIVASLVGDSKQKNQQVSIRVWHVLLIVLIVLLIVYVSTRYTLEKGDKYTILIDLVLITLAFAAAAGFGIHLLIRRDVEARAEEITAESKNVTSAEVHTSLGFVWYKHHVARVQDKKDTDKTKQEKSDQNSRPGDKAVDYLRFAIDETRIALEHANKLNEQRHKVLICTCKNNLAYYLAEVNRIGKKKVSIGDKELAIAYADYVHKAIGKHPDRRTAWSDTYDFVKSQFAPKEETQGNRS